MSEADELSSVLELAFPHHYKQYDIWQAHETIIHHCLNAVWLKRGIPYPRGV
jgi:hypothetical protein